MYIYTNAIDPDGSVTKVEYYRGGTTLIGTSTSSPFTYYWSGVPVGNYSLTAVAYDNSNQSATSAPVTITVNESAPYIYASATPTSGGAPLNVNFTATNTGGTVTAWAWTFGDGTTGNVQSPTHTYATTGSFLASVTATGPGGSSTYSLSINVLAPPAVTINATPISGTRPLTVSFSASNTGGSISNYAWNFGNGATSSSANPVYTYTTAGTFNATLTATNAGGSSTASRTITVNPISYTLTTCVNGNGTVTPPPGSVPVNEGVSTPITATAATGNQFEAWRLVTGSAVIANPALANTSVILSSNATVCADFHPNPVTLTLVHTGNGSTNPASTAQVIPGRAFDISAAPAAGYKFLAWSVTSGNAVIANSALASTRLTLTGASTVQAQFIPETAVAANKKLAISGELSDATGNRVGYPNPEPVDVTVRLWTAVTGGTVVHTESFLAANNQAVTVDDGFFVARLGEGATAGNLQQAIANNPQLWVEITIEGATPDVLSPRTPLTASAYALGGVPTLVPMSGGVLHGDGDPNAIQAGAAIGSYYVNDQDNSTWLKISIGWSQLH
jgi:PKD repeat protein